MLIVIRRVFSVEVMKSVLFDLVALRDSIQQYRDSVGSSIADKFRIVSDEVLGVLGKTLAEEDFKFSVKESEVKVFFDTTSSRLLYSVNNKIYNSVYDLVILFGSKDVVVEVQSVFHGSELFDGYDYVFAVTGDYLVPKVVRSIEVVKEVKPEVYKARPSLEPDNINALLGEDEEEDESLDDQPDDYVRKRVGATRGNNSTYDSADFIKI